MQVHKTTAETRTVSAKLLLQSTSDLLEQIKLHIADNGNVSADSAAACKAVFEKEMITLTRKMKSSVSEANKYVGTAYIHAFVLRIALNHRIIVRSVALTPPAFAHRQVKVFGESISTLVQSVLKPSMDRGVVKGREVAEAACC